jgi:uncharacterized protein (TIGR03435 family)
VPYLPSGRLALVATLIAFQPQAAVTFDVAVIRPNPSGDNNTHITFPGSGRLVVENASLRTLLRNAYSVLPFQLAGAPGWQDDAKFDINAKTEGSQNLTYDNFKLPLQELLADRFHLKVHWETREMPAYVQILVIDSAEKPTEN